MPSRWIQTDNTSNDSECLKVFWSLTCTAGGGVITIRDRPGADQALAGKPKGRSPDKDKKADKPKDKSPER